MVKNYFAKYIFKTLNYCILGFVFITFIIPISIIYKVLDRSPKFRKYNSYWIERKYEKINFENEF
jgi:hypothetical protein